MKNRALVLLVVATVGALAGSPSLADDKVVSPNAQVPYLGIDGIFTIDTTELAVKDPRNPKRVVFRRMETFSFYEDVEGRVAIAQNCRYGYKGAAGDPYYYPGRSKGSVWDLFELVSGDPGCTRFTYVALRAPHGNPVHMHMRYGDAGSSFERLLVLSDGPEDKARLDPWWSVYCAVGVSSCDT